MSEPKTVRVEIEFEDGRIIRLTGAEAEAWSQQVNNGSVMAFVHGMSHEPLPWKEFKLVAPVKP